MDCSLPGSSVRGILQARILEWVAMPSSRGSFWPRDRTHSPLILLHSQAGSLLLAPPGKPKSVIKWSCSVLSDSLRPHGLQPTRLLHSWDFPGKSPGVGCHFLLQGIFPTQGSNPGLLHCRQILYCLSHQRSPGEMQIKTSVRCHFTSTSIVGVKWHLTEVLICICLGLSHLLGIVAEKAMAPHSSTLAWKIPWTEEPGRLQSMGSRRVGHDWATSLLIFTFMYWRRKWQPTPMFLPGESQGRGSLVGFCLWGRTESDTTEVT